MLEANGENNLDRANNKRRRFKRGNRNILKGIQNRRGKIFVQLLHNDEFIKVRGEDRRKVQRKTENRTQRLKQVEKGLFLNS